MRAARPAAAGRRRGAGAFAISVCATYERMDVQTGDATRAVRGPVRTITQKKIRNGVDQAHDVTDCTQLLLRPPRGALAVIGRLYAEKSWTR